MNNIWYSLDLGDAIMADQPMGQIREAFEEFVSQNGASSAIAIFTRNDSEGRLHCQVTAYFSPNAIEIANTFQASPCPKPSRDNLDLLAGDESSWVELFSEKG